MRRGVGNEGEERSIVALVSLDPVDQLVGVVPGRVEIVREGFDSDAVELVLHDLRRREGQLVVPVASASLHQDE